MAFVFLLLLIANDYKALYKTSELIYDILIKTMSAAVQLYAANIVLCHCINAV